MKKLLALVLALVMTLGLATVSASAATVKYADKSDISYQEAADVLSAVGVFEGKGENFAPKDNLNRAEAAKLVAYLMLGNKTAEAIKGNGNRFSDVPADHWAVGYIEYLATAGVVSGVGDGKFNPNGQVTAVQFAKMLNVALGYDAQVEGYVGNSWNINIMKQANDDDIFKTLDIGSNDTLTREQAAQMCLNALKANTVEYESKGDTLTINNSTVVLNAKKAKDKTTTATKGNAIKDDDAWGTTTNPYTLQLGEDLYNGDLKMEETRDDFGRPANKWTYKMEKIGTYADTGILKATYTDEIKNGPIYDLLGSSVYDHLVLAAGANNYAQLHYFEDGVGYGNTTDGLVNGSTTAATNKTAVQYFVLKNGDKAINYNADGKGSVSSGRGSVTQVFVDKDDNVDIVVMNTYVYQAAGDYRSNTEDIVISVPGDASKQGNAYGAMSLNNSRLELNDFPQIKDYKKDDYLLITAYKDGNRYKVSSVDKAEKLTGKVDKVVIKDSVTIDGELKKYNKTATTTTKENEFSVGQEATLVLDKYGYIVYVDEAVVASNYVFISELFQTGGNTSKVQANAYFSDGTNQTITVKEIAKVSDRSKLVEATANDDMAIGVVGSKAEYDTDGVPKATNANAVSDLSGWYTYSKNSSDEYTLTAIKSTWSLENEHYSGNNTGDGAVLTKGDNVKFLRNTTKSLAPFAKGTAGAAKANDKTIMVVAYADSTDVDVYTGVKNLPDITLGAKSTTPNKAAGDGAVFSVLDGDGYARYVFVSLEGNYSVYGTESESLLYILKYDNEYSIANNKRYYTYKALDENANQVLIETDSALQGTGDVYEAFYKTSKNADGRYTRVQEVPTTGNAKYFATAKSYTGTITAESGTLTLAGESFTLAKNSKIVYVSRVDELNKKDTLANSDYEADITTADGLAAFVKGYTVTYDVQAKLDDNYTKGNGGKIIEAYVTISKAVPSGTATDGTATTKSGVLALRLPDAARGLSTNAWTVAASSKTNSTFTVYWDGTIAPTGAEINEALNKELAKYDALKSYVSVYDADKDLYNLYKNGTAAGTLAATTEKATVTSADDWSLTTAKTTDIVVVPAGVTMTVGTNNITVKKLIVDGKVVIKNLTTLTMSDEAHVLKGGHVDVTGGTWVAPTKKVTDSTIEGDSLVADDNPNNSIQLGNTSSTGAVTINGGEVKGTLESYGETKITGTTKLAATINVEGGSTSVAATATIDAAGKVENKGGEATVAGVEIDQGKDSKDGTIATEIATAQTKAANEAKAAAGDKVEIKDASVTLKGTEASKSLLDNKLKVTALTGAVKTESDGVYTINADTVKITIQNNDTTKDATVTVTVNYGGGTYEPKDLNTKVEKGSSADIEFTLTPKEDGSDGKTNPANGGQQA